MTKSVLIVEDDVLVALELATELSCQGYRVVGLTGNIAVAMRLARREAIDAAVLDVNLGTCTSYPVADELRERAIPFIFLTGYERANLARTYDDVTVLRKPVAYRELFSVLAGLRQADRG